MRILYLTDEFPPTVTGGAAIVAYNFAAALFKKGYEVFIITANQDRTCAGESEVDGIKVFTFYSKYPNFLRHYISLYNPFAVFNIKKILKNIKPDVVHAHNVHSHISYHSLKLAKKFGCKVFLTAHDTMLVSYGKTYFPCGNNDFKITAWQNIKIAGKRFNPFRNIAIKRYLRYVDKVFAISLALKEFLASNGIESELLHNGINVKEWEKTDYEKINEFKNEFNITNKKVVLFGGRLSGAKGGEQIIKSFNLVLKRFADAVLLIAGKKDEYARIMFNLANKEGISDKIIFTGWLDREKMKMAFFASDVCVTPSVYFDPFNLFNIEAMAAGKPVVGTCFGGTPEIVVDGQTGYIVNPLNCEEMGKKICELLSADGKSFVFGENGRKRAEEFFSLEKQAEKLIGWYEKK